MKIAKVIHHGLTRYRVNDPSGPDDKRQRKFFETRESAEAYGAFVDFCDGRGW